MEPSDLSTIVTNTGSPYHSSSCPSNSLSPPSSPPIVISPCAACKILRRRCVEKCVLAPYFPPSEPLKFTTAHRVFGASNIIKFLQELPESQRADAVSSMVYEANARIRDPVYGCAGAIWQLQKQVSQLQAQLAKTQADLVSMKSQQESLIAIICSLAPSPDSVSSSPDHDLSDNCYPFPANHNLLSNAAAVSATGVYVDDSATWEYISWA